MTFAVVSPLCIGWALHYDGIADKPVESGWNHGNGQFWVRFADGRHLLLLPCELTVPFADLLPRLPQRLQ